MGASPNIKSSSKQLNQNGCEKSSIPSLDENCIEIPKALEPIKITIFGNRSSGMIIY